jgi:hypothetical protein
MKYDKRLFIEEELRKMEEHLDPMAPMAYQSFRFMRALINAHSDSFNEHLFRHLDLIAESDYFMHINKQHLTDDEKRAHLEQVLTVPGTGSAKKKPKVVKLKAITANKGKE